MSKRENQIEVNQFDPTTQRQQVRAVQQFRNRIGILLADMGKFSRNEPVLKYLILHMNTLQKTFEFEFLPVDKTDNFIRMFSDRKIVERNQKLRQTDIPSFLARYREYLQGQMRDMREKKLPIDIVLVTTARFHDNYYSLREQELGLAILALGEWKRTMYPPSLIEIILTLILRQSVGLVSASLEPSVHLGTKGCLCDFTIQLDEIRQHVLNGFVCSYCRSGLKADGLESLADDLLPVLKRDWLGSLEEPYAPVRIASNLGYNLFITKGFTTTLREKIVPVLAKQSANQVFAVIAAVVIAYFALSLRIEIVQKD